MWTEHVFVHHLNSSCKFVKLCKMCQKKFMCSVYLDMKLGLENGKQDKMSHLFLLKKEKKKKSLINNTNLSWKPKNLFIFFLFNKVNLWDLHISFIGESLFTVQICRSFKHDTQLQKAKHGCIHFVSCKVSSSFIYKMVCIGVENLFCGFN